MGLQSSSRESFDSERGFKARFASHLIQNGASNARFASHLSQNLTSKRVSQSFESKRDFKRRFVSHLSQNGTSKRVSRVI